MHPESFIDAHWPNPHGEGDAPIVIYGYVPSEALCILALIMFSICLILHVYRLVTSKAWAMVPISFACIMELVGYSFRFESAHVDPYRINFFILDYFFIVIAPVFLSASIYACLSKILAWTTAKGFPNPLRLSSKTILLSFVFCDVVATIVQVAGAVLIGHAESQRKDPSTANHILLAGLAFQSVSFLVYLVMLGIFTTSIFQSSSFKKIFKKDMGLFTYSLWISSLLVFVRTVFRLAETSEGVFGYVRTHEVFFGTLDFAPIIVATIMLAIWYPGNYLSSHAGEDDETLEHKQVV